MQTPAMNDLENPRINLVIPGTERSCDLENVIDEEKEYTEWLKEMRGWLLVVAVLIATCAYTAGLSPPGGFWQDDNGHTAGTSVLADKFHVRYTVFRLFNSIALAQSFAIIMITVRKTAYFKGGKRLVRALQALTVGSIAAISIAHATIDVAYYYFKVNVPYLVVIFLLLAEFITWLQPLFSMFNRRIMKPKFENLKKKIKSIEKSNPKAWRWCSRLAILHVVLLLGVIAGLLTLSYMDSRKEEMWGNPGYKVGLVVFSVIGIVLWWFGK